MAKIVWLPKRELSNEELIQKYIEEVVTGVDLEQIKKPSSIRLYNFAPALFGNLLAVPSGSLVVIAGVILMACYIYLGTNEGQQSLDMLISDCIKDTVKADISQSELDEINRQVRTILKKRLDLN